jgi:hypothetical protein
MARHGKARKSPPGRVALGRTTPAGGNGSIVSGWIVSGSIVRGSIVRGSIVNGSIGNGSGAGAARLACRAARPLA